MDTPDKKLRKIHELCLEFAEMLRKLPFENKMDEAKARSFLSGIRDVLSAKKVSLESPEPTRPPLWEPGKQAKVDPEQTRAGLEEARRVLREGTDGC